MLGKMLSVNKGCFLVQFQLPPKNHTSNCTSNLKYGIDRTGLLFCINVAKQYIQYFEQSIPFWNNMSYVTYIGIQYQKNVLIRNQYNLPAGVFVATLFLTEFQNGKHRC